MTIKIVLTIGQYIIFSVAQTIQYIGAVLCRHNKVNSLANMVFYLE